MTTPIDDYPERFPYVSILEDCIAYWDFRDKSLCDIISNRLATWSTDRWITDHLGQLNSAVDIDSTSEQVTWTNLGTVGDSLMLCRQSDSWIYAWNEPVLTTTGINTGVTKSTLEVSIVMFFNRIMTTANRAQIETLLNIRYIYPTQQVEMQE